jgi:dipeptide/tripeptide permease
VFAAGAAVYLVGYAAFAWDQHAWPILLTGFLLSGIGIGFAETAESTVVAQLLPERLRSNGFGVLGLVQAFGDLGATLVAGVLWAVFSPTVAFLYAGAWMALTLLASGWLRPRTAGPIADEQNHG